MALARGVSEGGRGCRGSLRGASGRAAAWGLGQWGFPGLSRVPRTVIFKVGRSRRGAGRGVRRVGELRRTSESWVSCRPSPEGKWPPPSHVAGCSCLPRPQGKAGAQAGPEGPLGGQAESVSQASPSRQLRGALCKDSEAASRVTGEHTQSMSDVCSGSNPGWSSSRFCAAPQPRQRARGQG